MEQKSTVSFAEALPLMKALYPKVKKIVVWGLVLVGVFTILSSGFVGLRSAQRSSNSYQYESVGIAAPLSAPSSFGLRGLLPDFGGNKVAQAPRQGTQPQPAPQPQEGALTQRKVIKNGSLKLFVESVDKVTAELRSLAAKLGGFVQSVQVYEVSEGLKNGTVTARVPADKFDEAFESAKKLAIKVEQEQISAQDVTEQFVDLEAQLKNLRAEEAQYQEIMQRAFTIKDTLEVAQRLADVRGRIERTQGQLQYLARQVDMSTISVTLSEELGAEEVKILGIRWKPSLTFKQALRNMLRQLTAYADQLIYSIVGLPMLLLRIIVFLVKVLFWILVIWAFWKLGKWFLQKALRLEPSKLFERLSRKL